MAIGARFGIFDEFILSFIKTVVSLFFFQGWMVFGFGHVSKVSSVHEDVDSEMRVLVIDLVLNYCCAEL